MEHFYHCQTILRSKIYFNWPKSKQNIYEGASRTAYAKESSKLFFRFNLNNDLKAFKSHESLSNVHAITRTDHRAFIKLFRISDPRLKCVQINVIEVIGRSHEFDAKELNFYSNFRNSETITFALNLLGGLQTSADEFVLKYQ